MDEKIDNTTTTPQIPEILENKGTQFGSLSFEEIENLLSSTGLRPIKDTMRFSINSKNYIYFITNDGVLASLWFNPGVGYKLETIVKNVTEEISPEEQKRLKNLYDSKDYLGFSLTEDLVTFLEKLFQNENAEEEEKPEEPPEIPGIIRRTLGIIGKLLSKNP